MIDVKSQWREEFMEKTEGEKQPETFRPVEIPRSRLRSRWDETSEFVIIDYSPISGTGRCHRRSFHLRHDCLLAALILRPCQVVGR